MLESSVQGGYPFLFVAAQPTVYVITFHFDDEIFLAEAHFSCCSNIPKCSKSKTLASYF